MKAERRLHDTKTGPSDRLRPENQRIGASESALPARRRLLLRPSGHNPTVLRGVQLIYLSFAEAGTGGTGLAVARGTLTSDASALTGVSIIWRQTPKIAHDDRHFGGRLAFGPDEKLYITAGERHQGAPAQDMSGTLGKIVRINRDGSIPGDNPFVGTAGARTEIWTLGHRNPYGLVFAADGRLFESEMGPEGGDEFNLITPGANYGWRIVSEGNDGEVLPWHSTRPDFAAPLISWTPVIAPGGMISSWPGWLAKAWSVSG